MSDANLGLGFPAGSRGPDFSDAKPRPSGAPGAHRAPRPSGAPLGALAPGTYAFGVTATAPDGLEVLVLDLYKLLWEV